MKFPVPSSRNLNLFIRDKKFSDYQEHWREVIKIILVVYGFLFFVENPISL